MVRFILTFVAAVQILYSSIAIAQAIDYYALLAVADAAENSCSRQRPSETERYRHLIYIAYLGKDNAESFMADETMTRGVLESDTVGKAKYRVIYKESEQLLLRLTETELIKTCTLLTNSHNDVPGFLQQPKISDE